MKTILAALAALALGSITTPALAGDAECIWKAVPQAQRDAYVAQSDGLDVTDFMDFVGSDLVVDAVGSCTAARSETAMRAAGSAIAGITRQHVAEARLAKTAGLTPEKLDALWKTVDPAKARRLAEANHDQDFKTVIQILDELVPPLIAGLADPDAVERDMQVYILGRATRAYFEPMF